MTKINEIKDLVGITFNWYDIPQFTVTSVCASKNSYNRVDVPSTGEYEMPLDCLLSCINKGKFTNKDYDFKVLLKNRKKTLSEKSLDRQLDRVENYGRII